MATLGETSASATVHDSGNGTGVMVAYSAFSQYVFAADAYVSKLTASIAIPSGNQNVRLVMYGDTAGAPKATAILATDEVNINGIAGRTLVDFPIAAGPILVTLQTVWLAIWYGGGGGNVWLYDAASGTTASNSRFNAAVTYASTGLPPSTTWSTGGGRGAIYATYTNAAIPVNTVAPVVTGAASIGAVLTSTTGAWTG